MRILAIAADIYPERLGGAEAHFVEVLRRITPKVTGVTVVAGQGSGLKNIFPDFPSVTFVRVPYPKIPGLFGLIYIFLAVPMGLVLLLRYKYDLIWARLDYPQAVVGALLKLLTDKPLYVTSQNPRLATEEFFIPHLPSFLGHLLTPLISFAFRQANTVAAVSQYSADLAKKLGARRVVIIPNGVDLTRYKIPASPAGRQDTRYKKPPLKIITLSSLIPRNGIDTLIKACGLLDLDYELVIAGDGPLRGDLENLAIKLGIINRVKFLGRVTPDLVPSLLAASHLFVRPSRAEGFGNVFIEAMAAGVPIIGTLVGGISGFLISEETGLAVMPDRSEELAAAITRISRDTKLYEKLRVNGQKLVEAKYDWDIIAPRVLKEMFACL